MASPRLAILGGGAFVPKLVEVLAAWPNLPRHDLVLAARRAERAEIIARDAAARAQRRSPGWTVAAASVSEALEGADTVILAIRVGGLAARSYDEGFPRALGQVGDEGIGLGGMANAWRTFPVLIRMAEEIARRAPGARVLNLVAPLGLTTRALLEAGLEAVGLCELPRLTEEELLRGAPPGLSMDYVGLNHLGWFWGRDEAGRSWLEARAAAGFVDGVTLDEFHAVPLHYFHEVFRPKAAARLGLERDPNRAAHLAELSGALVDSFRRRPGSYLPELESRPTPWFDRQVVPVIAALCGSDADWSFADLPGKADWCPPGGVIETRCSFSSLGWSAEDAPDPPPPVRSFLARVAESEDHLYSACRERSPILLGRAVAALPLGVCNEAAAVAAILAGEDTPGSAP